MRRTVIGGAACPPAMMSAFQERHDVQVLHAWGMTEISPLGTVCTRRAKHLGLSPAERQSVQAKAKQGRAVFGVDMKIVGEEGNELPHDGRASSELMVRGPWIVSRYTPLERSELLRFYDGKIAKWWTPDDVVFVEAIPLGATGKMLKNRLRDMYRNHTLPTG